MYGGSEEAQISIQNVSGDVMQIRRHRNFWDRCCFFFGGGVVQASDKRQEKRALASRILHLPFVFFGGQATSLGVSVRDFLTPSHSEDPR